MKTPTHRLKKPLQRGLLVLCFMLAMGLFAPSAGAWLVYKDDPLTNVFQVAPASTLVYYEIDTNHTYYFYGYTYTTITDEETSNTSRKYVLHNEIENNNGTIIEAGYAVISTLVPIEESAPHAMDPATHGYDENANASRPISLQYLRGGVETTYTGNVPGMTAGASSATVTLPAWLVGTEAGDTYTHIYKFTQMHNPSGTTWAFRSGMTAGSEQVRGSNTSRLSEDTTARAVSISGKAIPDLYCLPHFAKGVYKEGGTKTNHAIRTPQQFQNMAVPGFGYYGSRGGWEPNSTSNTDPAVYYPPNATFECTFTQERNLDFSVATITTHKSTGVVDMAGMNGLFMGVYEGSNKSLLKLKIDKNQTDDSFNGLGAGAFAKVMGVVTLSWKDGADHRRVIDAITVIDPRSAIVRNLTVGAEGDGSYVHANITRLGGIVGCAGDAALFYNCTNYATIGNPSATPQSSAGGIAGLDYYARYENCTNHGAIFGSSQVGGIVGYGSTATYPTVGDPRAMGIYDCYNNGTVTGTAGFSFAGGIIGRNVFTVSGSKNAGSVSGIAHVGGIAGQHSPGVGKVPDRENLPSYWLTYYSDGIITGCENTAAVSGTDNVGGIVGINETNIAPAISQKRDGDNPLPEGTFSNSYVERSWNTGTVGDEPTSSNDILTYTGTEVGGIVGENQGVVRACALIAPGTVQGTTNVGGIVGYNAVQTGETNTDIGGVVRGVLVVGKWGEATVDDVLVPNAPVSGTNYVGGIVGHGATSSTSGSATSSLYRAFYLAQAPGTSPIYGIRDDTANAPVDCYVIKGATTGGIAYNSQLVDPNAPYSIDDRSSIILIAQPYAYGGDAVTLAASGGYITINENDDPDPGDLSSAYWYFPGGGYPYPHLIGIPVPAAPIVYGDGKAVLGYVSAVDTSGTNHTYTFTFGTRNVGQNEYSPASPSHDDDPYSDTITGATVAYVGKESATVATPTVRIDSKLVGWGGTGGNPVVDGMYYDGWTESTLDTNLMIHKFHRIVTFSTLDDQRDSPYGAYLSHARVKYPAGGTTAITMKNSIELWYIAQELSRSQEAPLTISGTLSGSAEGLVRPIRTQGSTSWDVEYFEVEWLSNAYLVIEQWEGDTDYVADSPDSTEESSDWKTIFREAVYPLPGNGGTQSPFLAIGNETGILTFSGIPYTRTALDGGFTEPTLRVSVYTAATVDGKHIPGRLLSQVVDTHTGARQPQTSFILYLNPIQ